MIGGRCADRQAGRQQNSRPTYSEADLSGTLWVNAAQGLSA